jgi:hypothetical protein
MNFKITDMEWIKNILGITELVKEQKRTNELLTKIVELEKLNINNMCEAPSDRYKAR